MAVSLSAGTAYIAILPDVTKLGAALQQQMASAVTGAGTAAGKSIGDGMKAGVVTGAKAAGQAAASEMRSAGSTAGSTFGGSFSSGLRGVGNVGGTLISTLSQQLGQTAGPLLLISELSDKAGVGFDHMGQHAKTMQQTVGSAALGVGLAIAGIGALLEHLGAPIEQAKKQLETAITDSGHNFDDYRTAIDKAIGSQEKLGHGSADTQEALAKLTAGLHDPNAALKEMGVVADLAAYKHTSLANAAQLVNSAAAGNTRALRGLGIDVKSLGLQSSDAAAAEKAHAEALTHLQTVQTDLGNLEERIAQQRSNAQQKYESDVATANDHVQTSEENLTSLRERLGEELAAAQQRYADEEETANQRVLDSEQRLADARRSAAEQDQSDQQSIQDARQAIIDFNERNSPAAKSNPALAAQIAQQQEGRRLTESYTNAQRKAAEDQAKSTETIAKAAEDLRRAQEAKAKLDVQAATIGQLNASQTHQLAAAEKAVIDAQAKLHTIQAKGPAGVPLADLQQEAKLQGELTVAKQKEADTLKAQSDTANALATNIAKFNKAIEDRIGGLSQAQADTFTGKLKALTVQAEDAAGAFGTKFGPAMLLAGGALSVIGGLIETGVIPALGKLVIASLPIAGVEVPILAIVAAVAVLAFGIYELVTHWSEVWGFIKTIASGAFNWLSEHWKLLLVILTGPFGLAAVFIHDHFTQIVDFVKSLPGRIASAAHGMWDGITGAFKAAINFIIRDWNHFVGFLKIPGFSLGPVHFGGIDLGSHLKIPELAVGGDITRGGLAWTGEQGPELVELPVGARVHSSPESKALTAGSVQRPAIDYERLARLIAAAIAENPSVSITAETPTDRDHAESIARVMRRELYLAGK